MFVVLNCNESHLDLSLVSFCCCRKIALITKTTCVIVGLSLFFTFCHMFIAETLIVGNSIVALVLCNKTFDPQSELK